MSPQLPTEKQKAAKAIVKPTDEPPVAEVKLAGGAKGGKGASAYRRQA